MNKPVNIIIILISFSLSFSAQFKYKVECNISSVKEGSKLYVFYTLDDKVTDSVIYNGTSVIML